MSWQGFTPGPWEVTAPGRIFVHSVRNFNAVCELNTFDRPEAVVLANARLIAAAPSLLAACESVVEALRGPLPADPANIIALLGGAVAKATGEGGGA